MLRLLRQLQEARTGHEQTALRRDIEAMNAQIDRVVYHLYGVTDEDIALIENASSG